jgi:alpha-galactosidase
MKTTTTLLSLLLFTSHLNAKPLKVFILAGQSNMEGHARIETFDYLGDDPATAPLLKRMRGADGKPATCEGAWISYLTGADQNNFELTGKLTAGYGSRWGLDPTQPGEKIGPEFTFGITINAAFDEPVLLIKTAWGGKSLHTDFRPPSAGRYQLSEWQRENYPKQEGHGIPKDFEKWKADKAAETGRYYRLMMEHVRRVLADPKRVCPKYDAAQGFELAGFVWLQGWNDMVDGHVYPNYSQPDRYALYSELLGHFIRDVRKDLGAPKLPFVIGVMGVSGAKAGKDIVAFREAMAAPASLPEFKGNVVAVETAPFWSEELGAIDQKRERVSQMRYYLDSKHKNYANADGKMTEEQKREFVKKYEADLISPAEAALWKRGASNAGYHYLGCAKTFALMGRAFAEATLQLMNEQSGP